MLRETSRAGVPRVGSNEAWVCRRQADGPPVVAAHRHLPSAGLLAQLETQAVIVAWQSATAVGCEACGEGGVGKVRAVTAIGRQIATGLDTR
jgi:hypothetical protein